MKTSTTLTRTIMSLLFVTLISYNLCATPEQDLLRAIRVWDREKAIDLIEKKHVNVNCKDLQGYTPAMLAAMTNNMEALTLLIHAKADLNVQNMPGQTALAIAALQNHIDCVKILLDAGAKITQMTLKLATNQGIKSLLDDVSKKRAQKMINAIHNEEISEAEALKLLDGGANINYKDEYGKTVLMEAAFAGYVNLVTSLLGMLEIDADQQDNDGNTALILAARGKHPAVVAKLLTDDINVDQQENKKGVNALMWAVVNNDVPTAKKLLQAGADVTIKNKKGATAMSLAKSDEMRKLLNKYLPK